MYFMPGLNLRNLRVTATFWEPFFVTSMVGRGQGGGRNKEIENSTQNVFHCQGVVIHILEQQAAVSASVCQLAPGSGESIKPRASCSTRSSFAGRVATTGVRAVVWAADPQ
eukprot:COSAG03_NODE_11_length_23018_cov_29.686461_5_plen_111_part_00